MSITDETAKAHANDPAVCCCRFEAGTKVEAANLEEPDIFPDLVDSGLPEMPDNVLSIGQVLGGTLEETLDALRPMTCDNVEGFSDIEEEDEESVIENEEDSSSIDGMKKVVENGVIKISIEEGTGIYLEIPVETK